MWLQSRVLFVQPRTTGRESMARAHLRCCSVRVISTIEKKFPEPPVSRTKKGSVSHSSPLVIEVCAPQNGVNSRSPNRTFLPGTSGCTEAHLSQDLLCSGRGARRKEDGDGALKPSE